MSRFVYKTFNQEPRVEGYQPRYPALTNVITWRSDDRQTTSKVEGKWWWCGGRCVSSSPRQAPQQGQISPPPAACRPHCSCALPRQTAPISERKRWEGGDTQYQQVCR